jgi:hypothetical protein
VRLVADQNLSFELPTSEAFQAYAHALREEAGADLPSSSTTVRTWIVNAYQTQKDRMIEVLHGAPHLVHITADGWTAPNDLPLLGVIAHFVNENGWLDHIILGLREIEGVHTGENLCTVLVEILSEYQIWTKLGYFVLDNAANNDTMLESFARHLETLNIPYDPTTHRLRCTGHVINLAVKAFLFGNSTEAIHDETYAPGTEEELERWRRCGPLGRAHNICVHTRGSPQRIKEFKRLSGGRLIRRDNSTRWNSWYTMLESIVTPTIQSAIVQYTANHLDSLEDDRLLPDDWVVLERMVKFLEPFKVITKVTEGRHASLADVLPAIDCLLDSFSTELSKAEAEHNRALAAMLKCGWETLDKYYSLTDRAPVYVAAVVLHPRRKWAYFHRRWKDEWILPAKRAVEALWRDEYQAAAGPNLHPGRDNPPEDDSLNVFERWLASGSTANAQDEYQEYCAMGVEIAVPDNASGAIDWWCEPRQRQRFPNLHRMAVDFLSIPAMSAEPERLFSECKRILTTDRHSMHADTLEAVEGLKSFNRRRRL